ncbi:MAG: amidotransferase [Chitinivibrionales bacterium]|nr:amidotransferase [Chitinivibrionales bacterium]
MKIHYLQHVSFEDPAAICTWARKRGHSVSGTKLFKREPFPPPESFDLLTIMGGPMSIHDGNEYPWLDDEKRFIDRTLEQGKTVLGICLGAQLIAHVLGARVYRNKHKEIGWFPVHLTKHGKSSRFLGSLPEKFTAFHWHGEMFDIPQGAVKTSYSYGCSNQSFEYENRVVALQFHLESNRESIAKLIEHCNNEITEKLFIQTKEEMTGHDIYEDELRKLSDLFMTRVENSMS